VKVQERSDWTALASIAIPKETDVAIELAPRIIVDPEVRFGKPVIRGTRVPVELILGKLAGGMEADEIVNEYGVTKEDVYAALNYAALLVASEEVRATT